MDEWETYKLTIWLTPSFSMRGSLRMLNIGMTSTYCG